MSGFPISFRDFLDDFLLDKLAHHFHTDKRLIRVVNPDKQFQTSQLNYGGVTFEVKVCNPSIVGKFMGTPTWDFDVRMNVSKKGKKNRVLREAHRCDYYILMGLIDDAPEQIFIIPSYKVPKSHVRISISRRSKYHKYVI